MDKRICTHCITSKETTEFYKDARSFSSWCKECVKNWSLQQAESGYFRDRRARQSSSRPPKPPKTPKMATIKSKHEKSVVSAPKRIPLTAVEKHAFNIWCNIRKRMIRHGKEFLPRAWVENAVRDFCANNYYQLGSCQPFQPSIDRIDNTKGYAPDNVRVVWLIENYARNKFTDADVIEFCKRKLNIPI